jgi:hypothetical protein
MNRESKIRLAHFDQGTQRRLWDRAVSILRLYCGVQCGVRSTVWKRFRLSSTKGFYRRPTKPPDGRIEIGPPWYATHCGSTFGDWKSALEKSATVRAIQSVLRGTMNRSFGSRRQHGRRNSAR